MEDFTDKQFLVIDNSPKAPVNPRGNRSGKPRPKGFQKGTSGNPKGRPKKAYTFNDIANDILSARKIDMTYTYPSKDPTVPPVLKVLHIESDRSIYHGVVAALITEAMNGNVKAISELLDRIQGKPVQQVQQENTGNMKIEIVRKTVTRKDTGK